MRRSPADACERALYERGRACRQGPFSRRGKFSSTCIRYSPRFRPLTGPLVTSILSSLLSEAALVARARDAVTRHTRSPPALVAAVLMPAVIAATDEEHRPAPSAHDLVPGGARFHPSSARMERNWIRMSESPRLCAYRPSVSQYRGGPGATGLPHLSFRTPRCTRTSPAGASFSDGNRHPLNVNWPVKRQAQHFAPRYRPDRFLTPLGVGPDCKACPRPYISVPAPPPARLHRALWM